MAKRLVEELTDDIDGTKADGTLAFSYDGTNYEVELNKRNRAAFDKAVAPYISAGRRVRAGCHRRIRTSWPAGQQWQAG